MENLCGFLNIYKEKGYTSHDVVKIIKKFLNGNKIGHTGTLDPDATGVLPICVGKATKLADYITSEIKEYKAIISLGKVTTTQDFTGEVLEEHEVTSTKQEIKDTINSFIGEIYQTPPMYSAIKVNGKRLYEIARQGKEIKRKQRLIFIYNIEINRFIDINNIEITVTCSKGTYIRTLCHDIGLKLGCGGYMSYLLRTKAGKFSLENAITIKQLETVIQNNTLQNYLIKVEDIFNNYKKLYINPSANKYLYNGNKISIRYTKQDINLDENEKVLIYDEHKNLVGIYIFNSGYIKPLILLF